VRRGTSAWGAASRPTAQTRPVGLDHAKNIVRTVDIPSHPLPKCPIPPSCSPETHTGTSSTRTEPPSRRRSSTRRTTSPAATTPPSPRLPRCCLPKPRRLHSPRSMSPPTAQAMDCLRLAQDRALVSGRTPALLALDAAGAGRRGVGLACAGLAKDAGSSSKQLPLPLREGGWGEGFCQNRFRTSPQPPPAREGESLVAAVSPTMQRLDPRLVRRNRARPLTRCRDTPC
jgi:hypothetical protein